MTTNLKTTTMKSQRLLHELSYEGLSKACGVSPYMLKKAELEPENVPMQVLKTIARYFKISTSTMFNID